MTDGRLNIITMKKDTKEDVKKYLLDKLTNFKDKDDQAQDALIEYYMSVDILSDRHLNLEFNNKDASHAAIVMANIFEKAKFKLCFFSGNFKGDICDNLIYLESLKKAIENKIEIAVVFENLPNTDSSCYKLLTEAKKIKISNILLQTIRQL